MSWEHGQLSTHALTVHFRGVKAVQEVDLSLRHSEILGLIGPNGAGKTTLVNAISGFQHPTRGTVRLAGVDVTGWPPHRLARAGLVRTFQNMRPFRDLTVRENIEAGAVATGATWRDARRRTSHLLEIVELADRANLRADSLPYGAERRLGIARAAATAPKFLLLDEPAAGLNEVESDALVRLVLTLRSELGCGILVIEHDMRVIMRLCERLHVLNFGITISVGTRDDVRADPAVIAAYLGGPSGGDGEALARG